MNMSGFFVISVFFLAIHDVNCFIHELSHEATSNVLDVGSGNQVILKFNLPTEKIESLQAQILNDSRKITYPHEEESAYFVCEKDADERGFDCLLIIRRMSEYFIGNWKISATYDKNRGTTFAFTLYLLIMMESCGNDRVIMRKGNSVGVILNNWESSLRTSCILFKKNSVEKYEMNHYPYFVAQSKEIIRDIRPIGECGVYMNVESNRAGKWSIQETIGRIKFQRDFEIVFDNQTRGTEENLQNIETYRSYEGSSIELDADVTTGFIYCEFERPGGYIIPSETGYCESTFNNVIKADDGIWIIRWSFENQIAMSEQRLKVVVDDLPRVDFEIVYEKISNALQVSIESPSWFYIDQCKIKHPNETIRSIYEDYKSCYFHIEKPSKKDFGEWEMSLYDGGNIVNVLMTIEQTDTRTRFEEDRVWISVRKEKYVKQGNAFTVKCATRTKLDYCWIKNSKGSLFSSKEGKESERFETNLENCGLESKVCGCTALIENANKNYTGNWTCQMGLKDKKGQMNSTIPIIITDSYLITEVRTIDEEAFKKALILQCRLHVELRYNYFDRCWWSGPHGNVTYNTNSSKFVIARRENNCDLQLNDLEAEDFGSWTCHISLMDTDHTYSSTIELQQNADMNMIEKISLTTQPAPENIESTTKFQEIENYDESTVTQKIPLITQPAPENIQSTVKIREIENYHDAMVNQKIPLITQSAPENIQSTVKIREIENYHDATVNQKIPLTTQPAPENIESTTKFQEIENDDDATVTQKIPLITQPAPENIQSIPEIRGIENHGDATAIFFQCRPHTKFFEKKIELCWWTDLAGNVISNNHSSKYVISRTDDYCTFGFNDLPEKQFGICTCNISLANIHSVKNELQWRPNSSIFQNTPSTIKPESGNNLPENDPTSNESLLSILTIFLVLLVVSIVTYRFTHRKKEILPFKS